MSANQVNKRTKRTKSKPRVLLLPDFPGWAFDIRANYLKTYLGHRYHFETAYTAEAAGGFTHFDLDYLDSFAAIYLFFWPAFAGSAFDRTSARLIIGVHSHLYEGHLRQALPVLRHADTTLVSTRTMQRVFAPRLQRVAYIHHGADHALFRPRHYPARRPGQKIVLGWVGRTDYKGVKDKGYYSHIVKLTERYRDDVELRPLLFHENRIGHRDMPAYYNRVDLYLCASKTEGGPLPNIEAQACGRPVITTAVGSMPELIRNGYNGYLVGRTVADFGRALETFIDQPDRLTSMGKNARRRILRGWTWKQVVKQYEKLFSGA